MFSRLKFHITKTFDFFLDVLGALVIWLRVNEFLSKLLFRCFESQLKRLENAQKKKCKKILRARKEYQELKKKHASLLQSYQTVQRDGI